MFYNTTIRTPIFLLVALVITASNALADNTNYVLTSRHYDLLKNLDRVADMAANVNTTGFKAENDVFTEYRKSTSPKERLSFSQIGNTVRDNSQGGMEKTGRSLDVAINGPGYFMVNTPYGTMFTRNGSIMIDKDGVLVNQDGYPFTGPTGGLVTLDERDVEISIKEDGVVNSGEEERGQIGVFVFDNEALVERIGKGLFKTSQLPKIAENSKIVSGMLETSNVNSVKAMTQLVDVSRKIETVEKIAQSHNDAQLNMIRKMSQ